MRSARNGKVVGRKQRSPIKDYGLFGCWLDIQENLDVFLKTLTCSPRLSLPDDRFDLQSILFVAAAYPHLLNDTSNAYLRHRYCCLIAQFPDAAPAVYKKMRELIGGMRKDKRTFIKWWLRNHRLVEDSYGKSQPLNAVHLKELAEQINKDPAKPKRFSRSGVTRWKRPLSPKVTWVDVRNAWHDCTHTRELDLHRLRLYVQELARRASRRMSKRVSERDVVSYVLENKHVREDMEKLDRGLLIRLPAADAGEIRSRIEMLKDLKRIKSAARYQGTG